VDFYKEDVVNVFKNLDSDENGLSDLKAKKRQDEFGLNELEHDVKINPLKLFFSQFKSFIVYILIFASVVSFMTSYFDGGHDYLDSIIILTILILNAVIGFFQEFSAQKNLESLKKLSRVEAVVKRGGEFSKIDSVDLVLGDIVKLESGDKVPADIRIISCSRLKVDEAALTGESLSVDKNSEKIVDDCQIAERKNMLFSGTNVSEGSCLGVVVKIGMDTEIGHITDLIKNSGEEITPLQKKLDKFGKKLGFIILGVCFIIFFTLGFKSGFSFSNSLAFLMIAISLAVAAVPEGLPAVVTIALSIGVKKLLKKKALVRKLSSVETLGSCDVICTDKTGTLTKNQMTVEKVWSFSDDVSVTGVGYNPRGVIEGSVDNLVFEIGFFCNNSDLYKKSGVFRVSGDPTEGALVVSAKKAKVDEKKYRVVDEIPFDSNRKMMSVLVEDESSYKIFTKGSTSHLLEKCNRVRIDGCVVCLTDKIKKQIIDKMNDFSSEALRVLGFAYLDVEKKEDFVEDNLIFVGLQAMMDPPREEVIDAIDRTKKAGIRTIMITGDHITTAEAIGKKIGIVGNAITGSELDELDDFELSNKLKSNTNIFARVVPEHKQRIVKVLQSHNSTVAMTGDGVNDAPALKKADIGISVGSGCAVAKEASDFVLLNDSFASIVDAIEEGRGIYQNIQKSIMLLLSGNFGEVMIVFLAVLFDFNLPLTALLLLWINLVTDGAPALAFSVDRHSGDIMTKRPISSSQGILPKKQMSLIVYLGMIGSLIGLFLFDFVGGNTQENLIHGQSILFCFVVLYEMLLVFFIRQDYKVKQLSNVWLYVSVIVTLVLQIFIIYSPIGSFFGVSELLLSDLFDLFVGCLVFSFFYFIHYFFTRTKN
jgi:Ca2+-transporting ATPase